MSKYRIVGEYDSVFETYRYFYQEKELGIWWTQMGYTCGTIEEVKNLIKKQLQIKTYKRIIISYP